MNMQTAVQTGEQIVSLLEAGKVEKAFTVLAPILAEHTTFRFLDRIGSTIGASELEIILDFLERIAVEKNEGGWPVIGSALRRRLERGLPDAFERARAYIIAADIWYGADILGERVPGPALTTHFEDALPLLKDWRADSNRWVRRAVGVAVHFWAKRAKGDPALEGQAKALLDLLEPMFSEWDIDAIKGVGWGLKTMGRYYPDLITAWLSRQVKKKHRAIMLNKATKFLSHEQRRVVERRK